jgi:hypothetical protein
MVKECRVCGGKLFAASEYRHSRNGGAVPALECADCRTLVLDEAVATSDAERSSIRLAKAVRAALANPAADPTTAYGDDPVSSRRPRCA